MKKFSTWAFRFQQLLAEIDVKISRGHAYELLAAGLKHNSYASLVQLESAALEQATLVIFDEKKIRARGHALGIDLQKAQYLYDFLDILDEPDEQPTKGSGMIIQRFGKANGTISDRQLDWSINRVIEHSKHENLKPIAELLFDINRKSYTELDESGVPYQRVLKSSEDAHAIMDVCSWVKPNGDQLCTDSVWSWSFDANVRLNGYRDGYEVPVKGSICINKLGRMLLGSAEITQLVQVGEPQMFDDDMDQGDVFYIND